MSLSSTTPAAVPAAPRERSSSRSRKSGQAAPKGLVEFSVVYTDRSVNHMSEHFQEVMRDVSATLKEVYAAHATAIVPGSGTYAMEAVARQFGSGQKCLVVRNGYFSYRWSQILEAGSLPSEEIVLKARPCDGNENPAYAPVDVDEVIACIERERPGVVFMPHVETSSGIMVPDSYISSVAEAVHKVGGLLVLDCIASGCVWVDMKATGVDVLISAPQKGWSGSPFGGLVMLSKNARTHLDNTTSNCFAIDLKKWVGIMDAYEQGGHMYHTTMPTDSIVHFREIQREMAQIGFQRLRKEQLALGSAVRDLLAKQGFRSVAAKGFEAPGVVVSYTDDPKIKSGEKFAKQGMQIAAGVPLMVDDFTQSASFKTFRLGLFGIDKMMNIPGTVRKLEDALSGIEKEDARLTSRL
eukprot:TRINITY_DN1931_c0_g3_i1.p1 TRINITY_DN1931_c0_g3~~TRINITY_DN1931_c0_g3_i1.p1  ORF type:complete len:410 (+),score=97.11 TRINITY_DN1931_c0_g3_i1:62-1291(+)